MDAFAPPPRNMAYANPQGDDFPTMSCMLDDAEKKDSKPRAVASRPLAIPLRGVVQHYAWGKPWECSIVAHMATEQVRSRRGPMRAPPLSRGQRYAELWMGTHPNGHSSVLVPGSPARRHPSSVNLQKLMHMQEDCSASSDDEATQEFFLGDVIESDPVWWLGKREAAQRTNVPFLFKVLSVRQALSIQAHPNKKLAEELNRTVPGHYPDDNHKPEICIPMGHFEALCGFRPVAEVRRHVREVPELQSLISLNEAAIDAAPLSEMYSRLMRARPVDQARQVQALITRLREKLAPNRDEELILRICEDYPTDVGLFSVYFLNYVVITEDMPNRFIYCAPDEPHAYLCGDAVECMALSDNVVRAGLTQKYKDVDTLLRMMTWRDDLLDELVNVGERIAENVVMYNPPVDDFLVYEIDGPVPEGIVLDRAAIAAVTSGELTVDFQPVAAHNDGHEDFSQGSDDHDAWRGEKNIRKGHTFFCRAGTQLVIPNCEEGAKLFIATY